MEMPSDARSRKRSASHMALSFPIIFLLSANLGSEELQNLEEQIPTLTYDINEAEVVLGKVTRKERALFELRKHKIATEEVEPSDRSAPSSPSQSRKRAKVVTPALASSDLDSDTASDGEVQRRLIGPASVVPTVKVVKLAWFTDSVQAGEVLPLNDYLVYEGRKLSNTPVKTPQPLPAEKAAEVIKRALADASRQPTRSPRPGSSRGARGETYTSHPVRPALVRQTTSEHEIDAQLPPVPSYLHTTYSCQRPTPVHPPNEAFIEELTKIRTARTLIGDKIGVRAYSSAIATIAAYPYTFQTAQGRSGPFIYEHVKRPAAAESVSQRSPDFQAVAIRLPPSFRSSRTRVRSGRRARTSRTPSWPCSNFSTTSGAWPKQQRATFTTAAGAISTTLSSTAGRH